MIKHWFNRCLRLLPDYLSHAEARRTPLMMFTSIMLPLVCLVYSLSCTDEKWISSKNYPSCVFTVTPLKHTHVRAHMPPGVETHLLICRNRHSRSRPAHAGECKCGVAAGWFAFVSSEYSCEWMEMFIHHGGVGMSRCWIGGSLKAWSHLPLILSLELA